MPTFRVTYINRAHQVVETLVRAESHKHAFHTVNKRQGSVSILSTELLNDA